MCHSQTASKYRCNAHSHVALGFPLLPLTPLLSSSAVSSCAVWADTHSGMLLTLPRGFYYYFLSALEGVKHTALPFHFCASIWDQLRSDSIVDQSRLLRSLFVSIWVSVQLLGEWPLWDFQTSFPIHACVGFGRAHSILIVEGKQEPCKVWNINTRHYSSSCLASIQWPYAFTQTPPTPLSVYTNSTQCVIFQC